MKIYILIMIIVIAAFPAMATDFPKAIPIDPKEADLRAEIGRMSLTNTFSTEHTTSDPDYADDYWPKPYYPIESIGFPISYYRPVYFVPSAQQVAFWNQQQQPYVSQFVTEIPLQTFERVAALYPPAPMMLDMPEPIPTPLPTATPAPVVQPVVREKVIQEKIIIEKIVTVYVTPQPTATPNLELLYQRWQSAKFRKEEAGWDLLLWGIIFAATCIVSGCVLFYVFQRKEESS